MSTLSASQPGPQPPAPELFVLVTLDGLRAGSCVHCVVHEPGRPDRAWQPNGDAELDFNRDALIAGLKALGVVITEREEYVCP